MAKATTERPNGLDTAQRLAKLEAAVAGLSSTLEQLDDSLGGFAGMVAQTRHGINSAVERIEALEDWCDVVGAPKARVADAERDLSALESRVGELMERVDKLDCDSIITRRLHEIDAADIKAAKAQCQLGEERMRDEVEACNSRVRSLGIATLVLAILSVVMLSTMVMRLI